MKVKVVKLMKKQVTAKNGRTFTKLSVFNGKQWFGCFEGDWNRHWREGAEIEAGVKPREWKGKTYYDLVPSESAPAVESPNAQLLDELHDLRAEVQGNRELLLQIVSELIKLVENGRQAPENGPEAEQIDLFGPPPGYDEENPFEGE